MPDSRDARLEEIILELQAEIRRQRLAKGIPYLSQQPDLLARVRQTQWVNPHLPIGWPDMPKGLLAKLSVYAKKITRKLLRWYMNPLIDQQNAFNAAVTEALSGLERVAQENRQLFQNATEQDWQAVKQHASEYSSLLKQQEGEYLDALQGTVSLLQGLLHEFPTRTQEQLLAHDWDVLRKHQEVDHLAEQQRYTAQLEKAGSKIQQSLEPLRLRLQRLETKSFSSAAPAIEVNKEPGQPHIPVNTIDSFVIGGAFRNEAQMAARLSDYDDLLAPLGQPLSTSQLLPVLDLGCGRGDLVAHLIRLGLPAYGVDLDSDAVTLGKNAGLDLRHEDAFTHLAGLADDSLQAVIAIQVIEHFSIDELVRLLHLINQKLTPNGILIVETINPVCLWALSNHYLLDPSHKTPLHPQMTQFLLEQAGFWKVGMKLLHPVPDDERLGWVTTHANDTTLQEIDTAMRANIARLNNFLYGPQDYAAIAYKPEDA